jgi:hypothetical protein
MNCNEQHIIPQRIAYKHLATLFKENVKTFSLKIPD